MPVVDSSISYRTASDPEVARVLTQFVQRDAFAGLVNSIIRDVSVLGEVASQSFPHPLGFNKIVLRKFPNGAKLRLHTWLSEGPSGEESDIHDHFWNYVSVSLTGSLTITEYLPSADGSEFHHYQLFPLEDGGHRQEFVGLKKLSVTSKANFARGDILVGKQSQIHSAWRNSQAVAATLVFQEPTSASVNNIFAKLTATVDEKIVKQRPLKPAILQDMLSQLVDAM